MIKGFESQREKRETANARVLQPETKWMEREVLPPCAVLTSKIEAKNQILPVVWC